jgi:hypothetical protein
MASGHVEDPATANAVAFGERTDARPLSARDCFATTDANVAKLHGAITDLRKRVRTTGDTRRRELQQLQDLAIAERSARKEQLRTLRADFEVLQASSWPRS